MRSANSLAAAHKMMISVVLLAASTVTRVLATKKFVPRGTRAYSKSDMSFGQNATAPQIDAIRKIVDEFEDVFGFEALPTHPCKAAPLHLALRPSYRSRQGWPNTKPQWPPEHREYLARQREQWVDFDIIEPCSDTAPGVAVCRITLADKDHGNDIRVCYDGRPLNVYMQTMHTGYTHIPEQVRRAGSKLPFKTKLDYQSAYLQIEVDEPSRRYLAAYLPDATGQPKLYRFKRMIFGLSTSAAYMVQWVGQVMDKLPERIRNAIAWYVDDVVIASPTFETHLEDLKIFFGVCRDTGMTLHPKKARFLCADGFNFLGYSCGVGYTSMLDDRVQAIRQMPAPTCKADIRHVMGVFATARNYIDHYGDMAQPIQDLLKKGVTFKWGPEQRQAFEALKTAVEKRTKLYEFDQNAPLVIHCDASQYAGGCWLAQKKDKLLFTIAYFSTTLTPIQRTWSAFHREAYILLWSLVKCRPYMDSSPHRTIVYTDAHSLQYVQASTRSALSSRLLAQVADLRFDIRHIKGVDNTVADALSRFRMLSPREMLDSTKKRAMTQMLQALPESMAKLDVIWVYMVGMQAVAQADVKLWRTDNGGRKRGVISTSGRRETLPIFDLAIIHVDVMEQVSMAKRLLLHGQPFCMLMCIDLVSRIFIDDAGKILPRLRDRVAACAKRIYLCHNHVWLIHDVPLVSSAIALPAMAQGGADAAPILTDAPAPDADAATGEVPPMEYGDTTTAIHYILRTLDMEKWADHFDKTGFSEAELQNIGGPHGTPPLHRFTKPDGTTRIIVPPQRRTSLIDLVHLQTTHAAAPVVLKELRTFFHWPFMSRMVYERVQSCSRCSVMQLYVRKLHGLFKARNLFLPRLHYGLDVKQAIIGKERFVLLLAVDAFSSYGIVMVMPSRSTANIVKALDEHVVYKYGPPSTLRMDQAKEFTSEAFKLWAGRWEISADQPAGYYPPQHGATERWWNYIQAGFRNQTDITKWRDTLLQTVFSRNCTKNSTTGYRPFDLFHGGPPNTPLANRIRNCENWINQVDPPSPSEYCELLMAASASAKELAAGTANTTRRQRAARLNAKSQGTPTWLPNRTEVLYWTRTKSTKATRPLMAVPKWRRGTISYRHGPIYVIHPRHKPSECAYRHHSHVQRWRKNFDRYMAAPPPWPPPEDATTPAAGQPAP